MSGYCRGRVLDNPAGSLMTFHLFAIISGYILTSPWAGSSFLLPVFTLGTVEKDKTEELLLIQGCFHRREGAVSSRLFSFLVCFSWGKLEFEWGFGKMWKQHMVKDCLLGSVSRTETTGGNKQSKFADKSQNYDNLSVIYYQKMQHIIWKTTRSNWSYSVNGGKA